MKTTSISKTHLAWLLAALLLALAASTLSIGRALGAGTLQVNDFTNYRVFQRDIGGSSKSVPISGTYSNMAWSRVEARLLQHGTDTAVVDWTTVDSTPGGGTFSGSLTVPQGGWYNLEVRALDGGGTELGSSRGTNKWGVGMIILVIGQSNMVGNGQPPFTAANSDLAVNYSNAGIWEHLADPYDDDSPAGAVDYDNDVISIYNVGGSMIPALANSLQQTFNFPIAFVPSAKGGSNLYVNGNNYGWAYRNPSNHFDTSTLYGQSITKALSIGGVELIIMHQGEADTNAHRSEAQYESNFATMIGNYRQDLYATIPIFICQLGTISFAGDPRTDADVVAVRNAQHDLDNSVNIFMAATAMDQPRKDEVHYTVPGLNAIGGRMAQAIKYSLGTASYYRGPSINSAFFSDGNRNQVLVTLNQRGGTDITPATGITGFEVFDNGASVTITSAVRYAANVVQLTLSRSIVTGHTVTLRYLYGMTPNVSGLVKDNSTLALPLENTTASLAVLNPYTLSVSKSGGGSGTVTSDPAGIDCGSDCSEAFAYNTSVTLASTPGIDSTFTGWSGSGCSGTADCTVLLDASKMVTAGFTLKPPPTFSDVPYDYSEVLGGVTYYLHDHIQALYNAGFTNGCNLAPLQYCPAMILNRGMAAKFLLNVNHGAGYPTPPLPADPVFTDIWNPDTWGNDGSWARPWAEQLYAEGLTNGCLASPLQYCPWVSLPRIQAAKFALSMKYGPAYTPPNADGLTLADVTCLPTGVPNDPCWGTPWAEQAYEEGLLLKCGTAPGSGLPLFCPDDPMDRAWTAYMIVKARGLTLP